MRVYTLSPDNPSVTVPTYCALCQAAFLAGDKTTLIPLPPVTVEAIAKEAVGLPYTTEALHVHVVCFVENLP